MSARFHSMADVRLANKHAGKHFFEEESMQFFLSEIESDLITFGDRQFFVTSEQYQDSQGNRDPRKYTLREVWHDGRISTVGGFQEHVTKGEALLAAYRVAGVST